ncbi:porin [Sphingomonas sp. KC8]|uniref:porin n=1 Tax=Sphingomonas sp. KC8 TaxID=1030157 RepID=UPI0002488FD8|nr:porin [Sphingomonas sp. KC8]ARS27147.1 porin [Sphingomonas sp. KC8]
MKTILLAGAALIALAPAGAIAQSAEPAAIPDQVQGYGDSSGLDTLVPAGGDVAAPPKTGDAVLDRLNELEAKVSRLEARNKELEEQASATSDRVEKVEVRAAKGVQINAPAPTFADVGGNFTFKPRGVIEIDYAGYNERAGGYDYSNGTDLRRGRFGFDGTAFKAFKWRIEAELLKGNVSLLDAYVSYGYKNWLLTVGQQKAPYGLEPNTSDSFNTFLERSMFNNAFGAVGAERRVGATVAYVSDKLNATVGVFGAGEAVQRSANGTADEGYSVNGRITWDPILDTGKALHFGASAFLATNFDGNSLDIGDRPSSRVDGGRLIRAQISGASPVGGPDTGAKDAFYVGAEAAVIYGPFSVQGEYGRLSIDRYGAESNVDFDGFYVFGSYFLTGESRVIKNGVIDRQKPTTDFNPAKGDWGAFEVALRYDQLNLTDRGLSPLDKKAINWTGALNWYLNPYTKLMFNYIRFKGENSPLVVAPTIVNGTTAKGEAFATRLHFDF